MIQVVCTPLNILLGGVAGYLASNKPFVIHSRALFIEMALNTYGVLVLLATFPPVEEITFYTTVHVTILTLLNELVSSFVFVTEFAILMANTDKRISALHVTVLGSMSNLSSFLHKTYIFKLIDMFGIYYPQTIISGIGLIVFLLLRSSYLGLQELPKKSWHVSDHVIAKKKSD